MARKKTFWPEFVRFSVRNGPGATTDIQWLYAKIVSERRAKRCGNMRRTGSKRLKMGSVASRMGVFSRRTAIGTVAAARRSMRHGRPRAARSAKAREIHDKSLTNGLFASILFFRNQPSSNLDERESKFFRSQAFDIAQNGEIKNLDAICRGENYVMISRGRRRRPAAIQAFLQIFARPSGGAASAGAARDRRRGRRTPRPRSPACRARSAPERGIPPRGGRGRRRSRRSARRRA